MSLEELSKFFHAHRPIFIIIEGQNNILSSLRGPANRQPILLGYHTQDLFKRKSAIPGGVELMKDLLGEGAVEWGLRLVEWGLKLALEGWVWGRLSGSTNGCEGEEDAFEIHRKKEEIRILRAGSGVAYGL